MARRATSLERLSAAAVSSHVGNPTMKASLHDGGGLYLRRFESERWFWYLRATSPTTSKETWSAIRPGIPFPRTSLSVARAEARVMREQLAKGIDATRARLDAIETQRDEKNARAEKQRYASKLSDVFLQWQETELQPRIRADGRRVGRKDGGRYIREQFERHVFASLGSMPIGEIRKADVFSILDLQVAAGKLRTANVLLADLKQLFRFAAEREMIPASPIDSIKKNKVGGADVERNRVLAEPELAELAKAIESSGLSRSYALAIWLILATCVRVGELVGAAWGDAATDETELRKIADSINVKYGSVDLTGQTWFLPDTKNQRQHRVHLSSFASTLIDELRQSRTHRTWLFPDRTGLKPIDSHEFGKQLGDRQRVDKSPLKNRTKKTVGLVLSGGKWTAHDLRRTAATMMATLGISNDVINECLNHIQNDRMSRVYIRDRREAEQARAFDALGDKLALIASRQK